MNEFPDFRRISDPAWSARCVDTTDLDNMGARYTRALILRNFKEGIGSLLTPVLTLWGGDHIGRHAWR